MSENPNAIDDEDLPEDLQPTDDNPLAQDLDEDEARSREELDVLGGKTPEESEEPADDAPADSSGDDSGD